jgi:hypothetical protein
MVKQPRHQSVVTRQSDSENNDDHWLKQFENSLQKNSVQSRDSANLFDQINSIMNTKSKYPSVQAAVDDMMHRSGLSDYLSNVKLSEHETGGRPKKAQQAQQALQQAQQSTPQQTQQPRTQQNDQTPDVIKQKESILTTLQNIIKDTKGNMPLSAIISKLHSLHAKDISEESAWDDEKLIRLVSKLNLQAKKDNPGNYENYNSLGTGDHSTADSDIDASNTDAFNALMPAKI